MMTLLLLALLLTPTSEWLDQKAESTASRQEEPPHKHGGSL